MPEIEKTETKQKQVSHKDRSVIWPLIVVFIFWGAVIATSIVSYQPFGKSGAISQGDDESGFSTLRAMKDLNELVGDSIPHPAGSEQNAVVRQRLISKLESFGYEVQVQSAMCKIPKRTQKRAKFLEVEVHNLVAIRKGSEEGKAIALVTHYDSHPAGPGANDDGVGVAALLEIARLYSDERRTPRRDLVFLITDGEEFGLLGAKAFCESNPIADQIGLVINMEARGTAGPSMMFETSPVSQLLVPVFARASPKPFSSSLFREIYKRLPNDTDFSVFQRHGKLGYNFAYIGDVKNYHTTADNFENVDPRCLEHHGKNALSLIRELQHTSELLDELIDQERDSWKAPVHETEVVYFDLFGWRIVWWPAIFSKRICLMIVALFLLLTGD